MPKIHNPADRLQLVARTNLFQYAHAKYDDDYDDEYDDDYDYKFNQIDFGLLGKFELGVYFKF